MQQLFQLLRAIYPPSDELLEHLTTAFEYREVKKGDHLLKAGQVCRHMFFIQQGLVRCYYYRDGREICSWFQTEGNMVISYESFYEQTPSNEYIVALEDCEIFRISHQQLQYVYRTYVESNVYRAELTELYYRTVWKCFNNTRLTSANERYQFFIENFPQWVNRVPEKDIAAFLGITPSHYSRSKW